MIEEVEDILKNLEDDLKDDWKEVLSRLEVIETQAKKYGVEDIRRLSVFSVLKERLERLDKDVEMSTYVRNRSYLVQKGYRKSV